jgi:tetratricopeptide (TPR) repeat protein
MTARYRTTTLDDLEEIPVAGVRWRPIRRTLGIEAFGTNAYAADAGEHVVETHDERGAGAGGHQELYVVVRGHARFEVDGETVDAPAGTLVFLPDPGAKRGAQAVEDGTLVLAIGADPERAYEVSPWESYFYAAKHADAGDFGAAVEVVKAELARHEGNPSLHYNLACYLARDGQRDEALEHLRRAVDADPEKVPKWAAQDSDLDSLRDAEGRLPVPNL